MAPLPSFHHVYSQHETTQNNASKHVFLAFNNGHTIEQSLLTAALGPHFSRPQFDYQWCMAPSSSGDESSGGESVVMRLDVLPLIPMLVVPL